MGERAVVVPLAALPTGRDRVLPARRLQVASEAQILLLAGARHGRQFLLLVLVVAVVLEVAALVRRGEELRLVGIHLRIRVAAIPPNRIRSPGGLADRVLSALARGQPLTEALRLHR